MDTLAAFIRDKQKPFNIAHRGASACLPENTLEAFDLAFSKFKVDMIEFDVHTSQDGIPVIIHDGRLERTTNSRGYVSAHSLARLKALDAGFHFSPSPSSFPFRGKGIQIPTLEEVLSRFPEQFLAVEIKEKDISCLHQVMALIEKYGAHPRCVVGSKHHTISQEMQQRYPSTLRFCSQREVVRLYFDFKTGKLESKKDPCAVASMPFQNCGIRFDDKGFIDYLHERRIPSFFWTVNDPELMKTLSLKKADGIITDYPARLREVLAQRSETALPDA